jgi:hypothetical protein
MSIQGIFSLVIRIEQKRKHSSAESLVLVKLNGKTFFKHKLRNASLAHLLSSDTRFTVTSSYTGISLLKQSQKNMIDYDSYHLPIGTKKTCMLFYRHSRNSQSPRRTNDAFTTLQEKNKLKFQERCKQNSV